MKQLLRHLCFYTILLTITIWVLGFAGFTLYALSFKFSPQTSAEGIVALTGGSDRIDTAVRLLEQENTNYLLISGVNKKVTPNDILSKIPTHLTQKISLGYLAENTAQNAIETSNWVQQKNISSILLVTSFYHMPRSIFEILKLSPNLTIIPYPVFPKSFDNSVDWIKTRYAWLLFIEYHKFIAVHLKYLTIERFNI
ncbi:MAG: YdcF family protein [Alphaproteobacteria bacterium]|nr:YdcF family protein [Alphaproteobacteria bacterium]